MTIKACDPCFHGECERCTSLLCACCGEREVASITSKTSYEERWADEDGDDSYGFDNTRGAVIL